MAPKFLVRPRHPSCSTARVPSDLIDRTRLFSNAVVRFCRTLPKTDEAQEVARQLRRAARSVRSNYRAARNSRSRAEFAARLGVVLEEADEAGDWLDDLAENGIATNPALRQEALELTRIFQKSLSTTHEHNRRLRERRL
jgi:four helix bundle protein